jgi:3',5'-cyclic AMP phosphodiesterase CpdA
MRLPPGVHAAAILLTALPLACSPAPSTGAETGEEPSPTPSPVIAAAGDIADCRSPGDEATVLLLDALLPDVILALGDNVYEDGTVAEFTNCYEPSWGRHKSRTRPAPGNHEYQTPGATGYFEYYGALAGPAGAGYYSFEAGRWHLISLNSNIPAGRGSAQLAWLEADLAAHPTDCALAYWHHPLISSGFIGNNPHMQEIWRALDAAGVDVVLVGHDHDYERFAPQNSLGTADPNGIREFVVGTGGKSLGPFTTIRPNSEARDRESWGVLRMTLHPTSYDWQFLPVAGKTFTDQGSASCA